MITTMWKSYPYIDYLKSFPGSRSVLFLENLSRSILFFQILELFYVCFSDGWYFIELVGGLVAIFYFPRNIGNNNPN